MALTPPLFDRTSEDFTIGLVNLPIVLDANGKPVKHYDVKKRRMKYETVPDMRYPFFELDTMNEDISKKILFAYRQLHLPVYVHGTMRGYHFICIVAMHKDVYNAWIKPLMKYNPNCPMVTLRIKPNKWIGEKEVFRSGIVFENDTSQMAYNQTVKLKSWIEHQFMGLIGNNYYLVKYRMTGEQGNL